MPRKTAGVDEMREVLSARVLAVYAMEENSMAGPSGRAPPTSWESLANDDLSLAKACKRVWSEKLFPQRTEVAFRNEMPHSRRDRRLETVAEWFRKQKTGSGVDTAAIVDAVVETDLQLPGRSISSNRQDE